MDSVLVNSLIDPAYEVEYNLRQRHPERTQIYQAFSERSERTRERPEARLDLSYGKMPGSTLDVFVPRGMATAPPLLVFIHGGYWRALDKQGFSFIAEAYLAQGIAVAMPNYALAPQAAMGDIVMQACQAVQWLAAQGQALGYDDRRIVLAGHSAGAQLAARAMCGDAVPGIADRLLGYVGLSGLFDLAPLLLTSVNRDVRMSADAARQWSVDSNAMHDVPVLLAVGELETEGFKSQSRQFATACTQRGLTAESMLLTGRNHFDMLADFAPGHGLTTPLFQKTVALLLGTTHTVIAQGEHA